MRALHRKLSTFAVCFTAVCATLLAGCGFQMQGRASLAPSVARIYVQADDAQSDFTIALRRSLVVAGATLVDNPQGAATLRIEADDFADRVSSISARNVPREYELTYRVRFALIEGGRERIAAEELSLTRDLSFDETRALGKEREREALRATLARELAAVVVQRLASLR
jgi:LPS-assembly lipoprotein